MRPVPDSSGVGGPPADASQGSISSPGPDRLRDLDAIVQRLAREAGFSLAGIAPVPELGDDPAGLDGFAAQYSQWIEEGFAGEMEYLKRRDEQNRLLRSSLRVAFPWARSVIVCAANYNAGRERSIDPASNETGWISRYAWTGYRRAAESGCTSPGEDARIVAAPAPRQDQNRQERNREQAPSVSGVSLPPSDYHDVLLARLKRMDLALKEKLGEFQSRCYVDTGPVSEKAYARYAGIGWTGKNTCILNQQLGSWFFLGVIVTALELPQACVPALAADRCGSCTRCIDACPTGALVEPYRLDARLCISYLTIEKRGTIPETLREPIGRQVFGCDICQEVCPWNRRAPVGADPDLAVREELVNPALDWLAELDAEGFRRIFNHSPLSRAKRAGLLRNVAIAMGNSGLSRYLLRLEEWAAGDDPVLADAARWAAAKLEEKIRTASSAEPKNGPMVTSKSAQLL